MESAEFTPGPWHPGHLGSDSTCQCANVVDEGFAGGICTIHVGNGRPVGLGGNDAPPREQAIANMHLIAAAPDMLEALQACATILPHYHMRGETTGHDEAHHAVLEQVQEAIALATGKGGGFGQGRR